MFLRVSNLCAVAVAGVALAGVAIPAAAAPIGGLRSIAAPAGMQRSNVPALFRADATKTVTINAAGGKLVLPKAGSFTGFIAYTSNNAPSGTTITMSTSTTNTFHAPNPPSGTAVWYFQAMLNGNGVISFNPGKAGAKLGSKTLNPANSYTLYGFVPAYYGNQPVFTIAAGHPNAKGVLKFNSPFYQGAQLPTGTAVDIELAQN